MSPAPRFFALLFGRFRIDVDDAAGQIEFETRVEDVQVLRLDLEVVPECPHGQAVEDYRPPSGGAAPQTDREAAEDLVDDDGEVTMIGVCCAVDTIIAEDIEPAQCGLELSHLDTGELDVE